MIPTGIEPAAFRVVAQYPNQLRHRLPPTFDVEYIKKAVYLEKPLFSDYMLRHVNGNESNSVCS
jgi:hypothetical protein